MKDIGDLLPTSEDLARAKVEGFELSTLLRLVRDLGAPPEKLREIRQHEKYDLNMFWADFPECPWDLMIDRVEKYSVQDLFQAPTKSPVFLRFQEHFGPRWRDEPCLFFFKARGFTTLVMGSLEILGDCSVVLKAAIRGAPIYVTTYEEFIDEVRDRKILEA